MKLEGDIHNRLRKLKARYLLKYLHSTQERVHYNCKFNLQHTPKKLTYSRVEPDLDIAPRKMNSLVVIQPAANVYICTHGMENLGWNGDLCDSITDAAPSCKWFVPKVDKDHAEASFDNLLKDDNYVLSNYPDIAALQWVIGKRVYHDRLGFFGRLLYAFSLFLLTWRRKPSLMTEGVPEPKTALSKDIWD